MKSEINDIVLVMAGGLGKRMNSELPKVLHILKTKPLIVHVIERALEIRPKKIGIIVGKYRMIIEKTISEYIKDCSIINYIVQEQPLGTGHAIMCCKDFLLTNIDYRVVILSGDVPLIKSKTIKKINNSLENVDACILVNKLEDPYGYGRIVTEHETFIKIVEEKDCTDIEKKINIVNSGIYSFKCKNLIANIDKINNNNSQKEYYLTDIFNHLDNEKIKLLYLEDSYEVMGVNTQQQLFDLEMSN